MTSNWEAHRGRYGETNWREEGQKEETSYEVIAIT